MIKKIKSRLSVKVFFLTAVLTASCCAITYLCIVRFAPYIYRHDITEADEIAYELSLWLSACSTEEEPYIIQEMENILSECTDNEFVLHIFRNTGEELTIPSMESLTGEEAAIPFMKSLTGKRMEDYDDCVKTDSYSCKHYDGTEDMILFAAQDTDKESQVVEALQRTLPIISALIFAVSVTAAFFYTWYITSPIKKVSGISRQMADMDFGRLSAVRRTDEIGVLSDSLNELSGKLSAALSELREANRKLQADIDMERQLERQRLEFFSAASHELKTPITIIKGQLQGMLYQVGRYKDREKYLADSLEVVGTLEKMVQELLTIARLDAPGYTCSKTNFDFGRLINERLAALEDFFMQRELTVEKFISPEVYLDGDVRLLEKTLDNLLTNAALYSPAENCVTVKLWKEGDKVRLTIENTGVHIPEQDIPKLFEAFYRVDPSRSRRTGGSGLGLYIVKTILDLHEAEIEAANSEKGVIFSVRF